MVLEVRLGRVVALGKKKVGREIRLGSGVVIRIKRAVEEFAL